MATVKKPVKVFVFLLIVGGIFGAFRYAVSSGLISFGSQAVVPKAVALPALAEPTSTKAVKQAAGPGSTPVTTGIPIRFSEWAWNAETGFNFANGGPDTTEGSLMAQHGLRIHVTREDDTKKMLGLLVNTAQVIAKDANAVAPDGVNFITLMGDGTAAWIAGANATLAKVCPDCTAEVVGSFGYSRGEDKFMGPAAWKDTPALAKGSLIAGVVEDGDWNIAQKWITDNNGLLNNPDWKTYDPDAINWVNVDTYLDAAKKYIQGTCESRPVVHQGKATGTTKEVCVTGVVTWTPGDVDVATKKGGLVTIASTAEYRSQMPCVVIGLKRWDLAHKDAVEGMLTAAWDGADQVRNFPDALHQAAKISSMIFDGNPNNGAYWERYYKGSTENDATGVPITLGGSFVSDLADNLQLFGLSASSKEDVFAADYQGFGDIVKQQYPSDVPKYPAVAEIENTTYVREIAAKAPAVALTSTDVPTYAKQPTQLTQVVSKKSWTINFESGSATFTPDAQATLRALERDVVITDLVIELDGHTDNTGTSAVNVPLSEQRAAAVKTWLMGQSASNFPADRFIVRGYGDTKPRADNGTDVGRAKNRRVDILMGQ